MTFDELAKQAKGETVRWWMYGGDARINDYVDDVVTPAAKKLGITVDRVPVADTADAVQRVVSEKRAGKTSGGAVDMIWINGENFASGKEAGLWLGGWTRKLPNSRLVDFGDPTINLDLQVPIDNQESPWSRAAFVYASDEAKTPDPPQDFDQLLDYARENPGRFTYPALPDFTGTSFVKQVVAAKGEDAGFDYLAELKPLMWQQGKKFPKSEAELNDLFAEGQVDFSMSFDPNFIATAVEKGQFAKSTAPFLLEGGALVNASDVTIPADAAHPEAAQVLANLLLEPALQAQKADPRGLGIPTVLDSSTLDAKQKALFSSSANNPYLLDGFGETTNELPADQVPEIEARWKREILP
ncbi:ABC transporter substrate-binding protein [soil metagenome]